MRFGGTIRIRVPVAGLIVAITMAACGAGDVGSKQSEDHVVMADTRRAQALPVSPGNAPNQSSGPAEGLYALGYRAFDTQRWLESTGYIARDSVPARHPVAAVGDSETFTVSDGLTGGDITATLRYANDHVAFWVEDGLEVAEADLQRAADEFASSVLPRVTEVFGDMPDPGIDGDPRLSVLHVATLSGAAGEFVSYDLLPADQFPGSNEREMIYMGLDGFNVGTDAYMATLAHELQHLLDFQVSRNTPLWMAEGMAQVAERIAGFDQVIADDDYLSNLAIPLNDWNILQLDDRHYGGSYLFLTYLFERFGGEAMVGLTRSSYTGMSAVADLARSNGTDLDTLVGDWVAAIALDDASVGDGRFVFLSDDLGRACPVTHPDTSPYRHHQTLSQFAPRYYQVDGSGQINVTFDGSDVVGAIPELPFRGEYLWWSGRADSSVSSMTRNFDLSGVSSATLEFRTWFDTGYDDGGMVQASIDGGETWTVLTGRRSESIGAGVGQSIPAYTGTSGSSTEPEWIRDEIDLGDYVGQSDLLVRFEYATDLFEGRIGWALDNIEIASIGYSDGGETGSDWELDGFIHTDNRFAQPWAVRVIQPAAPEPVVGVELSAGAGNVVIDGGFGPATIAVVATAPGVGTRAEFTLEIDGALQLDTAEPPAHEDFSLPCPGWEAEETDSYSLTLGDESLAITVHDENVFTWSAKDGFHEDVTIEATAVFENDEEALAGLICRLNADGFYDFEISSDGFYFAGVAHPGGYDTIQDWTESPAIAIGAGAVNDLSLRCMGSTLEFTINGTTVIAVDDDRVRAGQVALAAGSFDELDSEALVRFSQVSIAGTPLAEANDVTYSETFAGGPGEWSEFSSSRAAIRAEDGVYRVDVRGGDWSIDGYLARDLRDTVVDVEIRINEFPPDSIIAMACRTDADLQQYLFLMSADGFYAVMAFVDGEFEELVPWSNLLSIDTQPGAINNLHAECVGDRLTFEVNGMRVADVTDDRLPSGRVGFLGFTFERGGLSYDVLNVVLRSP
jgi:hypothetical protein